MQKLGVATKQIRNQDGSRGVVVVMSTRFIALLATGALICISTAVAKDFRPGDLGVCNASRCVPIRDRSVLRTFAAFFWGDARVSIAHPPRRGEPAIDLRFNDGSLAGVVGGRKLDRALVNGLNCGRFRRGIWYRLPASAAVEVSRLAAPLARLRVSPSSVHRSC